MVPAAGPVPESDHGADRRLADAARHRLRRPVPDSSVRSGRPGRGDDGGPARRRQGRQGPLPRGLVDVRLAVRQAAARRRAGWLDPVRVHAESVQPAAPPGRARADGRCAPTSGVGACAVLPAGQGPPGPALGRADPSAPRRQGRPGRSTRPWTSRSSTRCSNWPRARGVTMAQVALAWVLGTRPCPRRSSARPSRTTCPKPSPRSTCS